MLNGGNNYVCQCRTGYTGNNCQFQIQPIQPVCIDADTYNCPFYAANNLCNGVINGILVRNQCPKSCNCCNSLTLQPQPMPPVTQAPQCIDKYSNCGSLVASNSCNTYPIYDLCKRSCKIC